MAWHLKITTVAAFVIVAWLCTGSVSPAQTANKDPEDSRKSSQREDQTDAPNGKNDTAAFRRAGLEIGSQLPHVKIFDDSGKPLNTSSLKGSYTVLTFGCLT